MVPGRIFFYELAALLLQRFRGFVPMDGGELSVFLRNFKKKLRKLAHCGA